MKDNTIILIIFVILAIILGNSKIENIENRKIIINLNDSITSTSAKLDTAKTFYQIHSQIGLKFQNNICGSCERKMSKDTSYISLCDKIY